VEQHAHRAAFAQDPRVTALFPAALTRWLRGDHGGALRQAMQALDDDTDEFGTATILQVVGFLHCLDGRSEAARTTASRLLRLSQESRFPVYAGIGAIQLGWAEARLGRADDGLARMTAARDGLQAAGTLVGSTLTAVLLADAHRAAGRPGAALRVVEQALRDSAERRELAFAGVLTATRDELRLQLTHPEPLDPSTVSKGVADEHHALRH
jgi:hypothetical protein